jgi:hypothetical protein
MGDVIAFAPRRARSVAGEQVQPTPTDHRVAGAKTSNRPARQSPVSLESPVGPEPLWREVVGAVLREERRHQQRTLAQVAARAGMSVQYLSELERGRKEASSEMLSAVCGSLGMTLAQFAGRCAGAVVSRSSRPTGPVLLAA